MAALDVGPELFTTDLQTCEELARGDLWVAALALAAGDDELAAEYMREGLAWLTEMPDCPCGHPAPAPALN